MNKISNNWQRRPPCFMSALLGRSWIDSAASTIRSLPPSIFHTRAPRMDGHWMDSPVRASPSSCGNKSNRKTQKVDSKTDKRSTILMETYPFRALTAVFPNSPPTFKVSTLALFTSSSTPPALPRCGFPVLSGQKCPVLVAVQQHSVKVPWSG